MKLGSSYDRRIPSGHLKSFLASLVGAVPYVTPKKLSNMIQCEAEKYLRVLKPKSLPYIAIIDITNTCNLRCPYCPTGARRESGRKRGMIDVFVIQKLIDEIGDYLISANLFNWGEALLHPQIAAIINMFHEARIYTAISSNLSLPRQDIVDSVCDAGLDYMIVSLSGATQAVHEIYHQKANIDWVIENTRRLIEHKKARGLKKPIVEWKYLVFKHNRHEVETARTLAKKIGVDIFRWLRAGGAEHTILEKGEAPERTVSREFCHQLWSSVVVNADGGVSPCCFLFFKEDDFGDFVQDDIRHIRKSCRSAFARTFFSPSCVGQLPQDLKHPCLKCELVHVQAHLRDYLRSNPSAIKSHRTGGP
ncbi:MAG: radical SAM protein [Proteobacteria bacterium]|nr:radical SAM protein [Pseudomonadota bacterium]